MDRTLNIIPDNPDLVLVALNPTEEAVMTGAVFSRDNGFWNVLHKAGLIEDVSHIPLKERAVTVFRDQKYSKLRLGFADLLPLETEKYSHKIYVNKGHASNLANTMFLKNCKKVALLGQKVVDGFAKDFEQLPRWRKIKLHSPTDPYGEIGSISNGNQRMRIYAMPFPINNSIKAKDEIYKKLL